MRLLPVEKASMVVSGTDAVDTARALNKMVDSAGGTRYLSQQQAHPWVQVDMGAEQWVKEVAFCK